MQTGQVIWNWDFYAMDLKNKGKPFHVEESYISDLNSKGFDIYWATQVFEPRGIRRIENLKYLRCVSIEVDEFDEKVLQQKILSGFEPSVVIKSKRGYHLYWFLKNWIFVNDVNRQIIVDRYRTLVAENMVPFYGADPNATDLARILRAPFMRYWKDGLGEFHTDIVHDGDKSYELSDLEKFYIKPKKIIEEQPRTKKIEFNESDNIFVKASKLDCRYAIAKLSGAACVRGEVFTFSKGKSTTKILVNGKAHSMWLDKNGMIGSTSGGGPSIIQWLAWYGHDKAEIAKILKEFFPELNQEKLI